MTNRHAFPKWSPAGIVRLCESALTVLNSAREHGADADSMRECEIEADVCEKLAREPDMQPVWRALHRVGAKTSVATMRGLVREVVSELLEAPTAAPGSNAKRRKALLAVAAEARKLRERLLQFADDLPGWIRPEEADFADELERLGSEATKRALDPQALVKRRMPSAAALSLALRVCDFFMATLRTPLHEHAATIANVVCGSDLTKDNIKSALRYRRARAQRAPKFGR
ncbi:MAG: hypothetical protein WCB10_15045 [Steroidobacteraceae bacterium]